MRLLVDNDVFQFLDSNLIDETDTPNKVLRRLLGMDKLPVKVGQIPVEQPSPMGRGWLVKGVEFPEGTLFRAHYKGNRYSARVEAGGLLVNGKVFQTPSAAAGSIVEGQVNGWAFWEAQINGRWQPIAKLRAHTPRISRRASSVLPSQAEIRIPLLKWLARGGIFTHRDIVAGLGRQFGLSPEALRLKNESGHKTFAIRVGWTEQSLKSEGLIEHPRRNYWRITDQGRRMLDEKLVG
jgi:hypothetical protein